MNISQNFSTYVSIIAMSIVCTVRLSRHMPQDMRLNYITREKDALTNILRCRVGVTTVEKRDKSVETLGQQYNVVKKPTVILDIYINRHAGTPNKNFNKKKLCSTYHNQNQPKTM